MLKKIERRIDSINILLLYFISEKLNEFLYENKFMNLYIIVEPKIKYKNKNAFCKTYFVFIDNFLAIDCFLVVKKKL